MPASEPLLIEGEIQDRLHTLIAARPGEKCSFGGGFHPLNRIVGSQTDDSQAAAITHLRVRFIGQDAFKQPGREWPDSFGPMHHPRRTPFQVRLMGLWAMLRIRHRLALRADAERRSDSLTLVKDLDRRGGRADLNQLACQRVGHAVDTSVERDVIVDVDAGTRPLAEIESLAGQSPKCRPIHRRENARP